MRFVDETRPNAARYSQSPKMRHQQPQATDAAAADAGYNLEVPVRSDNALRRSKQARSTLRGGEETYEYINFENRASGGYEKNAVTSPGDADVEKEEMEFSENPAYAVEEST